MKINSLLINFPGLKCTVKSSQLWKLVAYETLKHSQLWKLVAMKRQNRHFMKFISLLSFPGSQYLNKCRWDKKAKRERSTHAAGLRRRDILFPWTSFLPLFFRRVQGTKRTNQEQRSYTQRSTKTRLSIVRVVWMCVNGVLVWTWVTDYSVSLSRYLTQ